VGGTLNSSNRFLCFSRASCLGVTFFGTFFFFGFDRARFGWAIFVEEVVDDVCLVVVICKIRRRNFQVWVWWDLRISREVRLGGLLGAEEDIERVYMDRSYERIRY